MMSYLRLHCERSGFRDSKSIKLLDRKRPWLLSIDTRCLQADKEAIMFRSIISCLAVISIFGSATATSRFRMSIHEKRADIGLEMKRIDRVPHSQTFSMRIGLTQQNLEHSSRYLMDVSDPASTNYGKHWTVEQIKDIFSPSDETIDAVMKWLTVSGIAEDRISLTPSRGWLAFDATVHEAEQLLETEYFQYENGDTGQLNAGCEE